MGCDHGPQIRQAKNLRSRAHVSSPTLAPARVHDADRGRAVRLASPGLGKLFIPDRQAVVRELHPSASLRLQLRGRLSSAYGTPSSLRPIRPNLIDKRTHSSHALFHNEALPTRRVRFPLKSGRSLSSDHGRVPARRPPGRRLPICRPRTIQIATLLGCDRSAGDGSPRPARGF